MGPIKLSLRAQAGTLLWGAAVLVPYVVLAALQLSGLGTVFFMAFIVFFGWWAGYSRAHGGPRGKGYFFWLAAGLGLSALVYPQSVEVAALSAAVFVLWIPATEWSYRCVGAGR